jgi:hypothetical protein
MGQYPRFEIVRAEVVFGHGSKKDKAAVARTGEGDAESLFVLGQDAGRSELGAIRTISMNRASRNCLMAFPSPSLL